MALVHRSEPQALAAFASAVLWIAFDVSTGPVQKITLEGTTWSVATVAGQLVSGISSPPQLALDAKTGRVSGFTGCNDFSARYRRQGRGLAFQRVTYTRKGCVEPALAKTEAAFLDALRRVRFWRIDGTTLSLLNAAGRSVMTLRPVGGDGSLDTP